MLGKHVNYSFLCLLLLAFLPAGVRAQGQYLNKLPNNAVNAMVEDHQGFLWIGTSHGLSRYDGYNYLTYYAENKDDALVNDNIRGLMVDAQGRVWISTECGLCSFENGHFRHPETTSFNLKFNMLDVDEETLVAADRQGLVLVDKETLLGTRSYPITRELSLYLYMKRETQEIWAANPLPSRNATEVYVFDYHLNLLRTVFIPGVVTSIQPDPSGLIWVLEGGELFCFDMDKIQPRQLPPALAELVKNNNVEFVSNCKNNSFFLAIRNAGIYHYDMETQEVESYITHQLITDEDWLAYQSAKGTLWLSDQKSFFQGYPRASHYQSVPLDDYAFTIQADHQHQVWFRSATRLYHLDPATLEVSVIMNGSMGEFLIDGEDRMFLVNRSNCLSVYSIRGKRLEFLTEYVMNANILSLCQDSQGRIWLAAPKSLGVIDETGSLSIRAIPDNATITGLYAAQPSNELLMTTEQGVLYRLENDQFKPFKIPVKNPSAFHYVPQTSELIIGSYNEGATFYDWKTGKTTVFTSEDNLGDNHVKTIQTDHDGNIWFGGAISISRLSPTDSTIVQIHDNTHDNGSLYSGSCIDEDNTLYFAGSSGLTIVHPDQLKLYEGTTLPSIILESFGVNGDTFDYVDQGTIHLSYRENMLLFRFIAIDLEDGDHIRYEYNLEGHDDRWIPSGSSHRASYSQLPAGNYVFRVRARMLNGVWSDNELAIPIVIDQAPWATIWAKGVYALLLLLIGVVGMRLFIRHNLVAERLQLAYKREQMKQEHIDFMANLSHEIRTPLMLVYAPLKELWKDTTLNEKNRNLVRLMLHNTEKLKRLVGQIMSTDQADTRERLHISEARLDNHIYSLVENFRFVATVKQLYLRADDNIPEVQGWYDAEKVEKILCNFLSNSIKYTPAGGEIIVSLTMEGDRAYIRVLDDGPGIPEDKQYKMFDRYERLGMDDSMPHEAGHGIGLNYSLFLAHQHKGDILYRQRQPHGSEFILIVPMSKSAYDEKDLCETTDALVWDERPQITEVECTSEDKEYTVLVAEDNPSVLKYLQHLLSAEYNVVLAPDGEEALESMHLRLPDLVITDVVMPHKDGFELCREIKQDEFLQLVPILMLTAKSDSDSHLKGLECGADAFLPKPFDPDILLGMVHNMLKVRGKLQTILRNTTSQTLTDLESKTNEAEQPALPERDRKFMEGLYKAIDAHLSDNEFNVNELAHELLVSYSLLYNKVKGLTGETPQHFLTTYRMNRAMEMLKTRKYTVSEVCYQVGASSPANFSKAFKKQFGVAPSSILQNEP